MAAAPILDKNFAPVRNAGHLLAYFNRVPKWVDAVNFASATNHSYTTPAGCALVHITADIDCYVQTNGGTAAAPVANVIDGSSSLKIPQGTPGQWWTVDNQTVFSFALGAAGNVYIECWA